MPHSTTFGGKTNAKATAASSQHSLPGKNASAFAPPAYGIDFADRGMPAPAPVQCVGQLQEERGIQEPFATSFAAPNRTVLPDRLKVGIESLSGLDLSDVRVHSNSDKPAQIRALAYAQGNDIHVAPGQERHLPHEAWHVVQQRQGRVQATTQCRGVSVNDDAELEREADLMGSEANRGATVGGIRAKGELISPSCSVRGGPIQRLIGFEIESRIPVWFENAPDAYTKPDYDTINADVGLGDGSKLTVDKEGTNSIIEFASGPVSDTQKKNTFENTATRWVNILTDLRADAAHTPPLADLHAKYTTAPANARFGFQVADATGEIDKVAMQVTHGLRLAYVEKYMSKMEYDDTSAGRDTKKLEALHDTKAAVTTVMNQLETQYNPSTLIPNRSNRSKALADFRGLIALIVHYLLLGGKGIIAYLKNQLSLFYKSKLSNVRNDLVGTSLAPSNAYAAHILGDATKRKGLRQTLLTATGRTSDQPLFPRATVKAGEWIRAVLNGTDDPFFNEAKNTWGTDIQPGTVKGKHAVVLEHRDLPKEKEPVPELKLSEPTKIVDYMVSVFRANKSSQDL